MKRVVSLLKHLLILLFVSTPSAELIPRLLHLEMIYNISISLSINLPYRKLISHLPEFVMIF